MTEQTKMSSMELRALARRMVAARQAAVKADKDYSDLQAQVRQASGDLVLATIGDPDDLERYLHYSEYARAHNITFAEAIDQAGPPPKPTPKPFGGDVSMNSLANCERVICRGIPLT